MKTDKRWPRKLTTWTGTAEQQRSEDQREGVRLAQMIARHFVALSLLLQEKHQPRRTVTSMDVAGQGMGRRFDTVMQQLRDTITGMRNDAEMVKMLAARGFIRLTTWAGISNYGRRTWECIQKLSLHVTTQFIMGWTTVGTGGVRDEFQAKMTSVEQEWGLLHDMVRRGMPTGESDSAPHERQHARG